MAQLSNFFWRRSNKAALTNLLIRSEPENAEVDLVPLLGEDLGLLPRQRLDRAVVLQNGELDRLQLRVEPDGELRLAAAVGDPDEVPFPAPEVSVVPERRHEAELLRDALVENSAKGKNNLRFKKMKFSHSNTILQTRTRNVLQREFFSPDLIANNINIGIYN